MIAGLNFVTGNPDQGRVEFQKARAIFTRYPDFDQYTKASTNVWTELSWASSEAVARRAELVQQHLSTAAGLVGELPFSPGAESLRAQVAQAKSQFDSMAQVANPSGLSAIGAAPFLK